jgi:hypothetical protein
MEVILEMNMSKQPMIKEMHEFMQNIPAEKFDDYEVRAVQWGDINVSFEKAGSDFDVTPLLKGLPDDLRRIFITGYKDHEEHHGGTSILHPARTHYSS